MTATQLASIALGGAVGAVGRFMVTHWVGAVAGTGFPFGTIAVNVIGSFLLGAFIEVSALTWSPSPEVRAMIVIGGLGAFTTFSTFSLDVVSLITNGAVGAAALYVLVSVVCSVAALWAGMACLRFFLT